MTNAQHRLQVFTLQEENNKIVFFTSPSDDQFITIICLVKKKSLNQALEPL